MTFGESVEAIFPNRKRRFEKDMSLGFFFEASKIQKKLFERHTSVEVAMNLVCWAIALALRVAVDPRRCMRPMRAASIYSNRDTVHVRLQPFHGNGKYDFFFKSTTIQLNAVLSRDDINVRKT
jgi:hypothetical protein